MKFILFIPMLLISFICGQKPTENSSSVYNSSDNQYQTESSDANRSMEDTSYHNIEYLKPQTAGLAFRDIDWVDAKSAGTDMLEIINSFIVKIYWKDIQPDEYGELKHPNAVDDAISYVRQMNSKHPGLNLNLKIRLYSGIYSPDWVKSKAGTFTMYKGGKNKGGPSSGEVVKFWKPEFLQAYNDVQKKLAAAYDNVPEITEAVNGGTGIVYAESMIRNVGPMGALKKNAMSFIQSDYSTQKDIDAIKSTMDAMKAWKHTRVSMVFTPFFIIQSQKVDEDLSISKSLLDYFVTTFGKQAVLGNNGLRDKNSGEKAQKWAEGGSMDKIYDYLESYKKQKGIGIYFQTATMQRIGSLSSAIEQGIARGAGMIELPLGSKGLLKYISIAELRKYDQMLEAQAIK